jgi:hypothetical protein
MILKEQFAQEKIELVKATEEKTRREVEAKAQAQINKL